jgi:cobalt-zinc-cadmium efflux system outer membrane protein
MCPDETSIPPGVDLADGLTEDEAVAVALWNNAAYQEVLTQLGISRAQLLDAGLLGDPQLTLFFPLGPKQLEFTIFQSIDFLWLRPVRVRAAELDLC